MKSILNTLTLIVCFFFVSANLSFGQSGTLDSAFGVNGKITTDLEGDNDIGHAVVIQPDGKIIVGGTVDYYFFGLVRYNHDGSIDYTFGDSGKVVTDAPNFSTTTGILSMAIQSDGKMIAAGGINGGFGMIRYSLSGIVDSTFGINGIVTTRAAEVYSAANNVFVLADGKIILSGGGNELFDSEFIVARYMSNGSLDSSFGFNGLVKTVVSNGGTATAASIRPNGNIIQGGTLNEGIQLIEYKPDGSLDSIFGNYGKLLINEEDVYGPVSLSLQKDEKILCSYQSFDKGGNNISGLLKLNANGLTDSAFGINGRIYNSIFTETPTIVTLNDSKIIQCGTTLNTLNNSYDFSLVRYNSNGAIDSSYGTNGTTITNLNESNNNYSTDVATAIAIQADNKIVVAGSTSLASGLYDFAVARYTDYEVLPITFVSFGATKKQTSVLLNWQTASEQDNLYFGIEKSANGNNNFKEIGKVYSKGNSNQLQHYSFEDFSPFNGNNFYRLKQLDKDGHITYSRTVVVDFSKVTNIKIYPNPVQDILTLEGLSANIKTTISIIDMQGSILARTTTANSTYGWNIKQLPKGIYFVKTETGKKITILKFVKE